MGESEWTVQVEMLILTVSVLAGVQDVVCFVGMV